MVDINDERVLRGNNSTPNVFLNHRYLINFFFQIASNFENERNSLTKTGIPEIPLATGLTVPLHAYAEYSFAPQLAMFTKVSC